MGYKLFTYGTLMKGQCRHRVLEGTRYFGDAVLHDYCLLELGSYPGAIPKEGFDVYGEVYEIDETLKHELDRIEGSQYEFRKVTIDLYGQMIDVQAYLFVYDYGNHPVRLPVGKWNTEAQDLKDYVWYVAYGSNILQERFDAYIRKTGSKAAPLRQKAVTVYHPVYFANRSESHNWGTSGVAFIDLKKKGRSRCWMYLISRKQFEEINKEEGNSRNWYDESRPLRHNETDIGSDKWGLEIRTMTNRERLDPVTPCEDYLNILAAGFMSRKIFIQLEAVEEYLGIEWAYDISETHIQNILDRLQ